MAFEITEKLKVVNPNASADKQEGPYASIQDALTATANLREIGRTVIIVQNPIYDSSGLYFIGGQGVEYWFNDGIEDSDLVIKYNDSNIDPEINIKGTLKSISMQPQNYPIVFTTTDALNALNSRTNIASGFLPLNVATNTAPVYIQFVLNTAVGQTPQQVTQTYIFFAGEGSWGYNGTPINGGQIRFVGEQRTTVEDIVNDPNTVTIDLGDLTGESYLDAANSQVRDLNNENSNYYFTYIDDGVLNFLQFIGENGTYGLGNTQLTDEDLIPTTNSGVTPGSDDIPLTGTVEGRPVTGNIEMEEGTSIYQYTGTGHNDYLQFDEDGISLKSVYTGFGSSYFQLLGDNMHFGGNVGFIGIRGDNDYSSLLTPDITQYRNYLPQVGWILDRIGETTGNFIPLTGTTEGNPVTGTIEFADTENGYSGSINPNSQVLTSDAGTFINVVNSTQIFSGADGANAESFGTRIVNIGDGNPSVRTAVHGSNSTEVYSYVDNDVSELGINGVNDYGKFLASQSELSTELKGSVKNDTDGTYNHSTSLKYPERTDYTTTGDFVAKLQAKTGTIALLSDITGGGAAREDIPDDFYIACTYKSDPIIRGRYLTYKTDTYRTFDLAPYIPDFVDGKIFSTNGIEIVDKNTIILSGQLTGTTGNLFTLVFKGSHIDDNIFTVDSSEFKELPEILRDNDNEPSKIQLAGYSRGFYYFVCRSTSQTPAIPTQVIKINPFNLSQLKIVSLPSTTDFLGSVQNAQMYEGSMYFLSTMSTPTPCKFIKVSENLDIQEVLFSTNNPGSTERVPTNDPFVIYNDKVFIPTIRNSSAGQSKIGMSVYDLSKKSFLFSVPEQPINALNVGSDTFAYPHWMAVYGGKLFIHTAAGGGGINQSRSLIRVDPNTLLVEASTPIPFRVTDDNTISKDGFIYLNPEAQSNAYLLKIRANFDNNETITQINEGAATLGYYSLGSPSVSYEADIYKTKLSEFYDDYPLKTINGETIKGTGDIVVSGGGGTTYSGTAPVNVTGSVISVLTDTTPTASSTNLVNSGNLLTALNLKGTLTGTNAWSGTNTFTGVFTMGNILRASADNTIDIGSTTVRFGKIFTNMMQATAYRPSTSTGTTGFQSFTGVGWLTFATTGVGTFAFSPIVPTPTASGEATNKGYVDGLKLSAILNITANRTVTIADFTSNGELDIFVDATSATVTVTLPTAALMAGYKINVIKTDVSVNSVTVKGAGTTNINMANTLVLATQYQSTTIKSNSTQYYVV